MLSGRPGPRSEAEDAETDPRIEDDEVLVTRPLSFRRTRPICYLLHSCGENGKLQSAKSKQTNSRQKVLFNSRQVKRVNVIPDLVSLKVCIKNEPKLI